MRFQKKDLFTIPNILTYIRFLCVPFMAWMVLDTAHSTHLWWALGLFVFASVTDVVDGFIARKCHMISDIGKVLDPLADKLLQITALITLTIIGCIHPAFTIIIVLKEVYMIIGAAILLKFARRKVTIQSNIWGKMATVFLAASVLSSFFHHELWDVYHIYLDTVLFSISCILTIIAAIQYTVKMVKEIKESGGIKAMSEDTEEVTFDESEASLHGGLVIDVDESEIEVVEDKKED